MSDPSSFRSVRVVAISRERLVECSLEDRAKEFRDGILIFSLTQPEGLAGYHTNSRNIAPWNSILEARDSGHVVFLEINNRTSQASGSGAAFDLNAQIQQLPEELHSTLSEMLAPLTTQFCHNELEGAQKCINLVTITVDALRAGTGLYEKAFQAIKDVRDSQRAHLDCISRTPDGATPEERAAAILDGKSLRGWLSAQAPLLVQLEKLQQQRGPLQADYQRAFSASAARVREIFRCRFDPVLGDSGWRVLRKDALEQIEGQLATFTKWLATDASLAVAGELAIDDVELKLAEQRITARKKNVVVVNFEAKEPSEQVLGARPRN